MSECPVVHSKSFIMRRFWNWFPLGLAYAFLYMGRYNLTVAKMSLGNVMSKEDFGIIFGAGTVVYAFSFLINGPLTDKIGGKKGMMISLIGASIMNAAMGFYISTFNPENVEGHNLRLVLAILYSLNMYFQSYGALSIVKVNSHWFHVRERGGFGGIFGTMISSGIFFAFTVNAWILGMFTETGTKDLATTKVVFFAPAILLITMAVIEFFLLKDRPGLAGHKDFDTGDATSGDAGKNVPVFQIMKRVITNPIILTVACIEFCTGVLRNGIMHWFPMYAKQILKLPDHHWLRGGSWSNWHIIAAVFVVAIVMFVIASKSTGKRKATLLISGGLIFLAPFVMGGWGGILMIAGVIGGNVAGWISDLVFQSRRAPAAGGLYFIMIFATIAMYFFVDNVVVLGIIVFIISVCVIGTHGLLSGTATMDFGGSKGAATAVGMIDGFVYLGTGLQSFVLGYLTTKDWHYWPLFLIPFAIIGFLLSTRIWNATPTRK